MPSERVQRRIEHLLEQADQAVDQLRWNDVRELAEAILSLDRENVDAVTYLEAAEHNLARQDVIPAAAASVPQDPVLIPDAGAIRESRAHPTSFVNGRYVVIRFLGEGGKKRVYLCHDTLLDRDVAFALIKTEGLDEVGRRRILREAQAMGRLGDHPNIVTVYEIGEENGQPYIISQFMAGGDVEGLIEKAEGHKLPIERALEIAKQVCKGLEHAHDKETIHRDIKPGNVWLNFDGVAKIGDFGLSVALDRSRLTQVGMMIGTVSYMPPEAALGGGGGKSDKRSDLYSLGAMLYEMVCGRPPFIGDDSIGVISQHINTPPVAPSWHNPLCSRPLEALIMRLLAKNPSERPNTASDVSMALESINLTAPGDEPVPDDSPVLDRMAGGVFVGRQTEMGELRASLEESLSGRGRLITLVGEPGSGKTRTAQELATYAALRGAQVLWGRSYEAQGVPPYWPWVQAIRSYVRDRDPEQLRSEMGSGAANIAEIVSEVRERLPGLQQSTVPEEADTARFRLFDAVATFLKSASLAQPLVIILDDLHWADQPSLALLEFIVREISGARLLLVGTYRDMELSRQHPLSQALGELARERLFQRILLRGLSQDDIGRFIEAASGTKPPDGLPEAVYTQTEGNPFFVAEIVRLLMQEGELKPGGQQPAHGEPKVYPEQSRGEPRAPSPSTSSGRAGESWRVRIPEGVKETIGRRLDHLSERCNQTLTVAAAIGREFELRQLLALVGGPSEAPESRLSEDRLLEVLDEALGARVIEELPRSVGRYQFSHALIQQTLAEELSTTRRVRLHARIAEALEGLYGPQAEAHASELAYHFAEAATVLGPKKMVRYSLLAGERALAAHAFEDAVAHLQRGLEAKETATSPRASIDAETAALLSGLSKAQLSLGQLQEGMANMSRAFDYYESIGEPDRAVELASYPVVAYQGRLPERAQLVRRALALAPPDSLVAGRLLSEQVRPLALEEGKYEEALESARRALAIAQQYRNPALEAHTLAVTASIQGYYRDWSTAKETGLQAIALAQRVDDPWSEALAGFWTISALLSLGEAEEARRIAEPTLAAAERVRDRWLLSLAVGANATVCRAHGEWQAAREFWNRREAIVNDGNALGGLALLEYETGDFSQSEIYLERFIARAMAPGAALTDKVTAGGTLARMAYLTGDASRLDLAGSLARSGLAWHVLGTVLLARFALALIAVIQRDAEAAQEQYEVLRSQGERAQFAGNDPSAQRLLALLCVTIDRLDQAADHFEDALAFCRKGGLRPELAWTCCDYADLLRARDATGDREKAATLLEESLHISTELGMRPLMERALSRREILKA